MDSPAACAAALSMRQGAVVWRALLQTEQACHPFPRAGLQPRQRAVDASPRGPAARRRNL